MDVFALREQLVTDYGRYAESFLAIRDERIREHVAERLRSGVLWPDPPLPLNPSYEAGGTVDEHAERILDSFRVLRENEEKAHGEFLTCRLVLERYDALGAASRSGDLAAAG